MRTLAKRAGGFTLVEVLVAMMVMAILAVMAWQGVDGIVRTRDASQARLEQTLRLNTVLAQWEQDLASVHDTKIVPALTFDGATLRLTRRTEGGVQLVTWSVRPARNGEPGRNEWQRWAGPPVTISTELREQWMQSRQFQGTEPGQVRVHDGVSQWLLYFYQGNAWSNAQSTGNLLPVAAGASAPLRQALPTGVRMIIDFEGTTGMNGTLTRDVALGPQWP